MSRKFVKLALFAAALISTLALVACGPEEVNLRIDMHDFSFSTDHWSVPSGAKVNLILINSGSLAHTWILMKKGETVTTPFGDKDRDNVLYEFKVEPGKTQTFEFDAPTEPGDYEVVCGEAAHLEQGMKGTLTVQ